MLLAIAGAVLLTLGAAAVGRALFGSVQPIDVAGDAVEAVASGNQPRLAELTQPPADDQLLGLVGAGDEVTGRTARDAADGAAIVDVEVRRGGTGDVVRLRLRLEPDEDGWVVVDASSP